MAEDKNIFGYGGGGGRRGGRDSDTDRRPGNSSESFSYSRRFDPRSEGEYTNRIEVANQIEQARLIREMEEQERVAQERLAGRQDVHFFPSVGKFIIPTQKDAWVAHAELVKDPANNLFFRPDKYVYFDKIVAEELGKPALTDPNHPDYAKYEGLRTNLAVLRNDIIGMYLDDGAFNPGDEKYIPLIAGIATELGKSLSHDKWYLRPFTRSFSVDVANIEGTGAREMYTHLLSIQDNPKGFMFPITRAVKDTFGAKPHDWRLPPLESTPFSDTGLSTPLAAPTDHCPPAPSLEPTISDHMAALSIHAVSTSHKLRSIDTLTPPTRETSVEEARKILRWLKNLQFGDRDMEEWLAQGSPDVQMAKVEAVTRLVEIYHGELYKGLKRNPALKDELAIQDGSDAAGALSQGILEHSMGSMPANHPRLSDMDAILASVPQEWEMRQTQSAERLLETLETGIEYASGRALSDVTPAQRILEKSNSAMLSAKSLRSIDTLAPPPREESIELAREILRRMKNLGFSKKNLSEIVDTGRPEDKAEFAKKVEEAVDAYKNIVAEAAQVNPNILNDAQVREGSEAAGTFVHTLKLMAAKEMPNSLAAAQQISADVTQMPEEWKGLDNRTVDRLVGSMEGGLEKAVMEIAVDQQQQQQDQDEQQMQSAAETAALHSEFAKRKKRRKRRSTGSNQVSGKAAAKRRHAGDLNGDGVLDKLQGLNQATAANLSGPNIRLSDQDLAAVRALGGNLRNIGDEANTLPPPPPVIDMAIVEKMSPDDKNFQTREKDQKKKSSSSKRPKDLGI